MIYGYMMMDVNSPDKIAQEEIESFGKKCNVILDKVFIDKYSNEKKLSFKERYKVLTEDILTPGDSIYVSNIDCFGENIDEIIMQLNILNNIGIRIMIEDIPGTCKDISGMDSDAVDVIIKMNNDILIDTLDLLETKKDIVKKGRKNSVDIREFGLMYEQVEHGVLTRLDVEKKFDISRATYFNYAKRYKDMKSKK